MQFWVWAARQAERRPGSDRRAAIRVHASYVQGNRFYVVVNPALAAHWIL
jgi:hypothetical protein